MFIYHILLQKSSKTSSPRVCRLPLGLYAKYHDEVTVAEALATQYVSLNTTIPVPTVLDVLKDSTGTFFLMTEVPGRPFAGNDLTLYTMSEEQVFIFAETLRGWFAQLRVLPPPPDGRVSGFLGTPFLSYRINPFGRVGPFDSVEAFHAQFFCTVPPTSDPAIQSLAMRTRARKHRLCFTHCDIAPQNILVDDDCRPVGLVDWESATWMPEYWQLIVAVAKQLKYAPWAEVFKGMFRQYEDELAVDFELWRTVSPF
ncbi:hypothetical protein AN958_04258 [Leucoagaricus sp. SymC.cos]|nr:hypothetical protein AN958_04258 [Leucoagaricus sp. SymC.cos]